MSDDMFSVITNTKPDNNEGGILSLIWRNILKEKGYLNSAILHRLLSNYVTNSTKLANSVNGMKVASSEKGRAKSTVIANVVATSMTIKTWMDLIFSFLGAKEMIITVTIKDASGVVTTHTSPTIINPRLKITELTNESTADNETTTGE
jgi:hypothetical protein